MTTAAVTLIILIVLGLFAFALMTDGRYFGKRLMYWVYDRLGPKLFAMSSEKDRWRALAQSLGLKGDERILDVGAGIGDLVLSLASLPRFAGEAVGVDWSPRMVATARETAKERGLEGQVGFEVVDVRRGLPFPDAAFDLVFCLGLLETIREADAVLRELARVLRPGGRLVLSLYQGRVSGVAALSLRWYEAHLENAALRVDRKIALRRAHDVLVASKPKRDSV